MVEDKAFRSNRRAFDHHSGSTGDKENCAVRTIQSPRKSKRRPFSITGAATWFASPKLSPSPDPGTIKVAISCSPVAMLGSCNRPRSWRNFNSLNSHFPRSLGYRYVRTAEGPAASQGDVDSHPQASGLGGSKVQGIDISSERYGRLRNPA